MDKDTSIIVRGIGKRYKIGAFQERQDTAAVVNAAYLPYTGKTEH